MPACDWLGIRSCAQFHLRTPKPNQIDRNWANRQFCIGSGGYIRYMRQACAGSRTRPRGRSRALPVHHRQRKHPRTDGEASNSTREQVVDGGSWEHRCLNPDSSGVLLAPVRRSQPPLGRVPSRAPASPPRTGRTALGDSRNADRIVAHPRITTSGARSLVATLPKLQEYAPDHQKVCTLCTPRTRIPHAPCIDSAHEVRCRSSPPLRNLPGKALAVTFVCPLDLTLLPFRPFLRAAPGDAARVGSDDAPGQTRASQMDPERT